jgi:hypothetical protein
LAVEVEGGGFLLGGGEDGGAVGQAGEEGVVETAADALALPGGEDGEFDEFKGVGEPVLGLLLGEGGEDGVVPPLAGGGGVAISEAEDVEAV